MVIWLKINDGWGFVGVSKGETMSNIDNHIESEEMDKIFVPDFYQTISKN